MPGHEQFVLAVLDEVDRANVGREDGTPYVSRPVVDDEVSLEPIHEIAAEYGLRAQDTQIDIDSAEVRVYLTEMESQEVVA
jgi:hypothetical protein